MTDTDPRETDADERRTGGLGVARRAVLRATGAAAALSLGSAPVAAGASEKASGNGGGASNPNYIDPVFGLPSTGPSPCLGESSEDCFADFRPTVRPSHEVNLEIVLPEDLIGLGATGVLSESQIAELNAAVADGTVDARELSTPEATVQVPDGPELTLLEIAEMLVGAYGFHYDPVGIRVEPGDVVVFDAETPDYGFAVFHEDHGRQRRLPSGVGPISAPLIPVGGYWLSRFETEGVYDCYCPPHEPFGMVMRVVVVAEGNEVPTLTVEQTGRPPDDVNLIASVFGGLDPNLPPAAAVFDSDALDPETIVAEGSVEWETVVDEFRGA